MPRLEAGDRRLISLLLTPSWLSGLVAIVVGLAFSIGVVVAFDTNNSPVQQQLTAWQQTLPQKALTTPDQTLPQSDKPTLKGSWPLLVLWSLAGLVIYLIAASIVHSLSQAESLRESLEYVNARPRALLESTAEHVLLRSLAVVVLIVFSLAFLHQIVPYSITAARASAADTVSLDGGLYLLLSFALIAVGLHIATIILRLSLGRARIFYQA